MYSMVMTDTKKSAVSPPLRGRFEVVGFAEAYWCAFESVLANTPQLLRAAHRLRYQVFCVENDIFDPARNPEGLERDEYDSHSLQAVLLHRATQMIVGTIRLVLHKPGAQRGSLPFHNVCRDPRLRDPDFLPLETTAEIGRFAICKSSRHRLSGGSDGQEPRRLIAYMTLGLIMAALRMCIANGVEDVCAVMEPPLLRLLARLGFHFEPLGPVVEYYGMRQPCWANVMRLFARVKAERPEVWEVTTDRGRLFNPGFLPAETAHGYAGHAACAGRSQVCPASQQAD